MRKSFAGWRANARRARSIWGQLPTAALEALRELTSRLAVSVAAGDLQFLENRWYVTHSGLLRIAQRRRCLGIRTVLQERQSDPAAGRWVFKATVYKSRGSRGFGGYGDADPTNVSPLVRGAEMRVAETRAVNRALRKAYGIGICSVEELGSFSAPPRALSCCGEVERTPCFKRLKQRPTSVARSALPSDPRVQSRSEFGESVRRRFLRHANPQRSQPRTG